MANINLSVPAGYSDWLQGLKLRIQGARQRALLAANAEQIQLYHDIGRELLDRRDRDGWGAKVVDPGEGRPLEVDIEPGQTIMLKVLAQRNGYDGNVLFGNEGSGRNLPHGLIVDNIGLNGLLILEKQGERNFFITASKWVPDQDRLFHLKTDVEGGQATAPVLIRVRRRGEVAGQ